MTSTASPPAGRGSSRKLYVCTPTRTPAICESIPRGRMSEATASFPNSRRVIIAVSPAVQSSLTRQRERVQRIARADDDELAAVEEIRLGSVGRVHAETDVPEWFAGERIVCHEIAAAVVAEKELSCRAQQAHGRPAGDAGRERQRPAPFHFA